MPEYTMHLHESLTPRLPGPSAAPSGSGGRVSWCFERGAVAGTKGVGREKGAVIWLNLPVLSVMSVAERRPLCPNSSLASAHNNLR
jgi:hypothetical protein